ncbi:MAG: hypothetical protein IPN69_18005 [Acidobacteria bacterium]|nr:hypothetical protein [Acidobacteriota bacterium]
MGFGIWDLGFQVFQIPRFQIPDSRFQDSRFQDSRFPIPDSRFQKLKISELWNTGFSGISGIWN